MRAGMKQLALTYLYAFTRTCLVIITSLFDISLHNELYCRLSMNFKFKGPLGVNIG